MPLARLLELIAGDCTLMRAGERPRQYEAICGVRSVVPPAEPLPDRWQHADFLRVHITADCTSGVEDVRLRSMQTNGDVDRPGLKDRLWHTMRADLAQYIPEVVGSELLLCPTCCRLLPYRDFDIEHILPKQAVDQDPPGIKAKVPKDRRSGVILLCRKTLKVNGVKHHGLGCNSWKGKHYDSSIAVVLRDNAVNDKKGGSAPWTTSMFAAGFLALVEHYGYQPALTASGLLMRRQFFSPGAYLPDLPTGFQMFMMASSYRPPEDDIKFWSRPFRFAMGVGECTVMMRNIAVRMPMVRDPGLPIAKHVRFAPKRFVFAPDYSTVFE